MLPVKLIFFIAFLLSIEITEYLNSYQNGGIYEERNLVDQKWTLENYLLTPRFNVLDVDILFCFEWMKFCIWIKVDFVETEIRMW